jgi:hypothetical protein
LVDSPNITVDFDTIIGDEQPDDVLFTSNATGYNYNDPALLDMFIHVYDPDGTEGTTGLKAFKLETVRIASGTPARAQVRGLATKRYSGTIEKETTSGTCGLLVANSDFA